MGVKELKRVIKNLAEKIGEIGELKPNTKNVYYGVGGSGKNNAWVDSLYIYKGVLMVKFRVSVDDGWAFCVDSADNFFMCAYLDDCEYINSINGREFNYSQLDIKRCVEHCNKYYDWYCMQNKPYVVSFG